MSGAYEEKTPASRKVFTRAERVFAGGVNHNARYFDPYPLFASKARGQHLWDVDGNRYVDYWMGHMALILGHSPKVVVDALRRQVANGTHYGTSSLASVELAEEVCATVPCAEMLRLCNSGAEATMYLVRLSRGATGRRVVVKMEGGWHGYNTDLNKGVHSRGATEGSGILPEEQAHVRTLPFNDLGAAERLMREEGRDVAAVFLEPVLGAGGCLPAERDYLRGLRELTERYGALLAFDEIITGYRVALGGAQARYGVTPDLATFGKIAGGGLPLGLVCGRREILARAAPGAKGFVSIGGGTFSENPLSMAAGLATLRYLRKNARSVYPALERKGAALRRGVDEAFGEAGVEANTTGLGSLFLTHLPGGKKGALLRAYVLSLMAQGVFMLPGHPGAVSIAHTNSDLKAFTEKTGRFAKAWAADNPKSSQ